MFEPQLRVILVPLFPPISEGQAKQWSQEFWPTVYNGGNPLGPHPSILIRAEREMQNQTGEFMALAMHAGIELALACKGEGIGAVVVERNITRTASIAAVAGDARWNHVDRDNAQATGNVTGHAVMRAIGMVARKRRAISENQSLDKIATGSPYMSQDEPLTPMERRMLMESTLSPAGYLCVNLELFITHEPCVMCSMAILHSRFGRVVFGERMAITGGLTADKGHSADNSTDVVEDLGYGLFWRPELNWRFLTWQFVDDHPSRTAAINRNTYA